jgi:hypothetical protein
MSDRPIDKVLGALRATNRTPGRSGDGWICQCPAHDDRRPSLSVTEASDGKVLIHCHVGCATKDVLQALGLRERDLFPPKPPRNADAPRSTGRTAKSKRSERQSYPKPPPGGSAPNPCDTTATVQLSAASCTLASYAAAKRLPLDFLRTLGLSDITYVRAPAVRIPYPAPDGAAGPVRFRTAMEGPDRFKWKAGSKIILYGLDRLDRARRAGYIVIVEGESDCHTLWFHEEPAVGVAGAANWRDDRDAGHLDGIATMYVLREPDTGGDRLLDRLGVSKLRDRIRVIQLNGFKDPSALHVHDVKRFREAWDKAKASSVPLDHELAQKARQRREALAGMAADLIRAPDVLSRFAADLERAGVVGEVRTAKLIYLAITSRLLDKPVSVAVKGTSSSGKSFTAGRVLGFFPASAYYALSAMSERALAYSQEPLKHRTLVIFEAAGLVGDFGTYLLRSLLSEGCVRYETVEKGRDGLRPRLIVREGPTNLLVTTTSVKLHPENETRMFSLPVTDTPAQTAAVMRRLAEGGRVEIDYARWHALQDWLAGGDNRVVIPFAHELAERIPPIAVRLRRDFGAVLSLVMTHALLHEGTRGRDQEGRIVATLDDYEAVRLLVADLIADGIGAGVARSIRETVGAVAALRMGADSEVSVSETAARLKLDKSAASRRVKAAVEAGYLVNREDRRGRPARLVLGEPLPDDIDILPGVDVLQRCSPTAGLDSPTPRPDPDGRSAPAPAVASNPWDNDNWPAGYDPSSSSNNDISCNNR